MKSPRSFTQRLIFSHHKLVPQCLPPEELRRFRSRHKEQLLPTPNYSWCRGGGYPGLYAPGCQLYVGYGTLAGGEVFLSLFQARPPVRGCQKISACATRVNVFGVFVVRKKPLDSMQLSIAAPLWLYFAPNEGGGINRRTVRPQNLCNLTPTCSGVGPSSRLSYPEGSSRRPAQNPRMGPVQCIISSLLTNLLCHFQPF